MHSVHVTSRFNFWRLVASCATYERGPVMGKYLILTSEMALKQKKDKTHNTKYDDDDDDDDDNDEDNNNNNNNNNEDDDGDDDNDNDDDDDSNNGNDDRDKTMIMMMMMMTLMMTTRFQTNIHYSTNIFFCTSLMIPCSVNYVAYSFGMKMNSFDYSFSITSTLKT